MALPRGFLECPGKARHLEGLSLSLGVPVAQRRSHRWGCFPRALYVSVSVVWSVACWPGCVPHPCGHRAVSKGVIFVSCLRLSSNCVSLSLSLFCFCCWLPGSRLCLCPPFSVSLCLYPHWPFSSFTLSSSPSRGFPVLVLAAAGRKDLQSDCCGKGHGDATSLFRGLLSQPCPQGLQNPAPSHDR